MAMVAQEALGRSGWPPNHPPLLPVPGIITTTRNSPGMSAETTDVGASPQGYTITVSGEGPGHLHLTLRGDSDFLAKITHSKTGE